MDICSDLDLFFMKSIKRQIHLIVLHKLLFGSFMFQGFWHYKIQES